MNRRIWLPIAVLVLSSLACSLFGRAEQAIEVGKDAATKASEVATAVGEGVVSTALAETAAQATQEPEPADEAVEDAPSPQVDADALSGLDSYRLRMISTWTPQEGPAEVMTVDQEHKREPAAQRLILDMGDDVATEMVQIGDQAWYCSGGSCTQAQADPDELTSRFEDSVVLDPADLTEDANARFIGRQRMNGVQTRHYALDLMDSQAAMAAEGEVTNLRSDVWIADEPGLPSYTARFEMSWDEEREEGAGKSEFSYDVYDVNTGFTIDPPEGVETSGLPDDVPLYPNSSDLFSMEGMATFTAPDEVASVVVFYRDALPAQGWVIDSEEEIGDMVNQVWQKEGRMLTLLVAPSDDGVSVLIAIE